MIENQGNRLRHFCEKSGKKMYQIAKESNLSKATLYNYFDLEEIEKKKVLPILDVLNISYSEFLGQSDNNKNEVAELKKRVSELESEKEKLLYKIIELQDEIKARSKKK